MTQEKAFEILKTGHNIFLTGAAGSGKTYLLNKYISYLKDNNIETAITASTGIAATHINGITLHSWSGIGIKDDLSDKDLKNIAEKKEINKRIVKTKVLIIDEISMLHYFRLDFVDKICKFVKQNSLPFGGIQVVQCGDFFQLPPVNRTRFFANGETDEIKTKTDFVYKSNSWQNMNLKICYLDSNYRHQDYDLIKILNDIRENRVEESTLAPLRKRYNQEVNIGVNPTKLYSHNVDVESINKAELDKIPGKIKTYLMQSRGANPLVEYLKKNCLAPVRLELKINASVMFVKNSAEGKYVNGTLGKIVGFDAENMPITQTAAGKRITAAPQEWTIEENGKIKAKIIQIPLRLAWAITIHKSQGMSLDAAHIDLSKSFVNGMGYTALSRVRSLNGLKLIGLNYTALKINSEVLKLDKELKNMSETAGLELKNMPQYAIREKQKIFLRSASSGKTEKNPEQISTYEETKKLLKQKLPVREIAKIRKLKEETIINHIEKIVSEDKNIDLAYLKPSENRFKIIESAFRATSDRLLAPVKNRLGENFSYNEIRLAKIFIK